jgi:isopropylmalate/homocitrate/citramalate synthase
MKDLIVESVRAGQVILWEEVARDGAQAKTMLSAEERIEVARATAAIFDGRAPHHLIFAAGFPSIHPREFEIMRRLAAEVDGCWLASHGRGTREDIALGARALAGARFGRLTFFVPVSEPWARRLLDRSLADVERQAVELARYALDCAQGMPVDVALADASRADAGFVGDLASSLAEEGVAIIKLCDSVGCLRPWQTRELMLEVRRRCGGGPVLGAHLHNDMGLALANNLEVLRTGGRVIATSWLGLGERVGLGRTEELLLAVGQGGASIVEGTIAPGPLFTAPLDLRRVVPLARGLAASLNLPLRVTDPVVGPGVNCISTGTPFIAPNMFRPYDPAEILGVAPTIQLTHLANGRVIAVVADELGFTLNPDQIRISLEWVKSTCYDRAAAVLSKDEFAGFLRALLA